MQASYSHYWIADENDILAGKWVAGTGELYCRWSWQAKHLTLTVSAAGVTDRRRFEVTPQMLAANHLHRVFPEMALRTAGRLKGQTERASALASRAPLQAAS